MYKCHIEIVCLLFHIYEVKIVEIAEPSGTAILGEWEQHIR